MGQNGCHVILNYLSKFEIENIEQKVLFPLIRKILFFFFQTSNIKKYLYDDTIVCTWMPLCKSIPLNINYL